MKKFYIFCLVLASILPLTIQADTTTAQPDPAKETSQSPKKFLDHKKCKDAFMVFTNVKLQDGRHPAIAYPVQEEKHHDANQMVCNSWDSDDRSNAIRAAYNVHNRKPNEPHSTIYIFKHYNLENLKKERADLPITVKGCFYPDPTSQPRDKKWIELPITTQTEHWDVPCNIRQYGDVVAKTEKALTEQDFLPV
jgi:hypothetical protein